MSANMQIGNMVGYRPVEMGVPGQVAGPQASAFGQYRTGDSISAEVVSVDGKNANIQLPNGTEVKMQFPEGVPARPGDMVDLTLVSKNQNSVQLKLEAINGQSVQLESTSAEAYLMDRGIPATRLNEAAAQVFIRNQVTPTPRNVSNLIDIAARLPEIPTSIAVTMAQNNIPPTKENANILMQWATGQAMLGNEVDALQGMVARDSGVAQFTTALQSNMQQQSPSPQLAAAVTQAPGFEQLAQQLSGMTGQDASASQQAIQNFTATLDLPPQQQNAVQNLLTQAFAATAEQFGEPVHQTAEQPVQQQAAAQGQEAVQNPATPAQQNTEAVPRPQAQPAPTVPQDGRPAVQNNAEGAPRAQAPQAGPQSAAQPQPQAGQGSEVQAQQPAAAQVQPQGQAQTPPQSGANAAQSPVQPEGNAAPAGQQTAQTQETVVRGQSSDNQGAAAKTQNAGGSQPRLIQPDAVRKEPIQQSAQQQSEGPRAQTNWSGPRRLTLSPEANQPAEQQAAQPQHGTPQAIRNEASQILANLHKFVVRTKGDDSVQEDGQALEQGVRHQRELAGITKEGISRLFGQGTAAAQKANELSNQVRLGSQMDQFFYAQIPYETREMKGTADLYVFQRHPQKAESERTHITVLIGLDTQHMGRVESVLRSAEGKLSVQFRVATTRVQRFMEDTLRTFSQEMKESGFPLESVSVTQIKEKVTPVNAMKVMEPDKPVRLQGLDIEA